MIPVAGAVRIGSWCVHGFKLSIPFLLLWVLLLPLLVLVIPLLFIAFLCARVNPFKGVGAILRMLAALKGTRIDVENDYFSVLVNIF